MVRLCERLALWAGTGRVLVAVCTGAVCGGAVSGIAGFAVRQRRGQPARASDLRSVAKSPALPIGINALFCVGTQASAAMSNGRGLTKQTIQTPQRPRGDPKKPRGRSERSRRLPPAAAFVHQILRA